MAALYLQVSIVSQALIFVTRSRSWSFVERPGLMLMSAFVIAQLVCFGPLGTQPNYVLFLPTHRIGANWIFTRNEHVTKYFVFGLFFQVATFIAVYANWGFADIKGCGWGWAGVIWLYSLVFYVPLDLLKFAIRYILSGRAWDNLLENRVNIMIFSVIV